MAERTGPAVYSIAAHRGFADALASRLVAGTHAKESGWGLADTLLLLPNSRARRAMIEAFVRQSGNGLLLPRMAVIGDADLAEAFDPALIATMGAEAATDEEGPLQAVEPLERQFVLAGLLASTGTLPAAGLPERLRLAGGMAATLDRLAVEDVAPERLAGVDVGPELAEHWQRALAQFTALWPRWKAWLGERGRVEAAVRRNRDLAALAAHWQRHPPAFPVIAAGITTAAPAMARLLAVIARLPGGQVVLPDLDLELDEAVWEALSADDAEAVASRAVVTHPQFHLRRLLDAMGVRREEVRRWSRSGPAAAPPERRRAISNLFLPPAQSPQWRMLDASQRRLSAVRVMTAAHPGEEAQAIAILVREALETPERRVMVVTPDRELARRVAQALRRWGIEADDSAGTPLRLTPAGALFALMAEVAGSAAAPVPLLGLLGHPLVRAGDPDDRRAWMDRVRALDLALRGPAPAPGLAAYAAIRDREGLLEGWWPQVAAALAPLFAAGTLGELAGAMTGLAEDWCGETIWSTADGAEMASLIEAIGGSEAVAGAHAASREWPAVLAQAMDGRSVRPRFGQHPRVSLLGLLEARLQRADLVICAGLNEGSWPRGPAPDAILAPAVLRVLGMASPEERIGLAAHDLAGLMGAPEVVLSRARRDAEGPTVASRFLLRLEAMMGSQVQREERAVALARAIDAAPMVRPARQPRPMPSPAQRRVPVSASHLDRLRGDPFQFYARSILRLGRLDPVASPPSPAWRGTVVHTILEDWCRDHGADPDVLARLASEALDRQNIDPMLRALWRPRLLAALEWLAGHSADMKRIGRQIVGIEKAGSIVVDGITVKGKADRIDMLPDGGLAIIDYKTGKPPGNKRVMEGFALQLGVLGLIAREGGFASLSGEPTRFEYWSLARTKGGFGFMKEPLKIGRSDGIVREQFIDTTVDFLRDAIRRWLNGDEPFTARLNPDLPAFDEFDQLMRLQEWLGREDSA